MQKSDRFGVMKNAVELIEKHLQYDGSKARHFAPTPNECKSCTNIVDTVKENYKVAEQAQINLIRTQSKAVNSANDILRLYSDSLYSFTILGIRTDMLKRQIDGQSESTTTQATIDAIKKDVSCSDGFGFGFDSNDLMRELDQLLDGDNVGFGCSDAVTRIVEIAYNCNRDYEDDIKNLMTMYLYHRLNKTNSKLKVFPYTQSSVSSLVSTKNWADRSFEWVRWSRR